MTGILLAKGMSHNTKEENIILNINDMGKRKEGSYNFDKNVQMFLACAKDDNRPAMECVYFKGDWAYASDGHIIVKNRISECSNLDEAMIQALDGKLLHSLFFKDMLKYDDILISDDGIECHKKNDKAFFYFADENLKYPDAEKVIQNYQAKPSVPLPQISFNMGLFDIMRKALYECERCTATFKGVNEAIIFDSMVEDVSSIGLIMPLYNEALNQQI